MCIFSGDAKVFGTTIFTKQLFNNQHVTIYSNTVESKVLGNKMILPIPANVDTVVVKDGVLFIGLMDKINETCQPEYGTRSIGTVPPRKEKVGMYNVTYCNLEQLKGQVSDELHAFFTEKYKVYSFVICEWEDMKPISAQPIVIEYTTLFMDFLYFPMMDGHGAVPKVQTIKRNHALGFSGIADHGRYKFIDSHQNIGFSSFKIDTETLNGDTWIEIQDDLYQSATTNDYSYTGFETDPNVFKKSIDSKKV